jgi:hypothetical protein
MKKEYELTDKHEVKAFLDVEDSTLRRYRQQHWIEGVHWVKINCRTVRYNLELIKDWVENKHDPAAHNKVIAKYKNKAIA